VIFQAADTGPTTLSSGQAALLLAVVIGGSLLAGLFVILGRRLVAGKDPAQSVVRSWLAISLVFGLLCFCAAAFEINDPQLRNTLLGGLVASTGAATAFYFSSKGADKARADILQATTTLAQGAAPRVSSRPRILLRRLPGRTTRSCSSPTGLRR
jgi:drug/metabolite transporter (DMT)-like permease